MEAQMISIALCTYNGEKHLHEQMDSLLKQDYPNLEIVILDDCSTDRTYELLLQYQEKYPQIRLNQNKENLGFNKNFEAALLQCKGEFIAIADQDDIWEQDKISQLAAKIGDNLLIYHDSLLIDVDGQTAGRKTSNTHRFVKGQCASFLLYNNCVSGHTCLMSKALLPHLLPFPEGIYYDWWMAYTAACLGKIDYLDLALVKHRRHASSSTSKDKISGKALRIKNLSLFQTHPLNPQATKTLIKDLLHGYAVLKQQSFSRALCWTLLKNSKSIFYTRRKSLFSQIKFILKESTR
ncbi:glycosyltransferase family 2 protein [Pedobacter gandavensis]|uniref:glycosyltransferase family 2 protein n=1 Tax=Pedobacter gandavensis TaxID=2679963 RepID=UPI002478435D|nr:glycosyltransferase family 2 protein [Pedobacter gandavensis]WGQ07993.1 glycosyltransferase family 2 protein [Pedobacter gandavensis]